MAMTYLQVIQEVMRTLNELEPSALAGATGFTAEAKVIANRLQGRLTRKYNFKGPQKIATVATVVNQQGYALPSDYLRGLTLRIDSEDQVIEIVTPSRWQREYAVLSDKGLPSVATIFDEQFHMYPIPDEIWTMTLAYQSLPADMTVDADLPSIPDDLLCAAVSLEMVRRHYPQDLQSAMGEFADALSAVLSNEAAGPEQHTFVEGYI